MLLRSYCPTVVPVGALLVGAVYKYYVFEWELGLRPLLVIMLDAGIILAAQEICLLKTMLCSPGARFS